MMRRFLYRRDVAVARHRATVARTLGLTDIEMLALVHIAHQGELAPSALGRLLDLSSGGVTALVQRLERARHVTRRPHPSDRRSSLVRLVPRTAERLEQAESLPYRNLETLTSALARRERVAVREAFAQLAALSEEHEKSTRASAQPPDDALARPVPSLWA